MAEEQKENDKTSFRSLKIELSEYVERNDSSDRWLSEVYPGVERSHYDFTLERQNINSNNLLESTSNLIKGCLGAGIFSIHVGYMRGGLWASLAASIVIGTIVTYNMYMLASSAHKMYVKIRVPKLTYPDLVEAAVATGPLKCLRKYSKTFRYSIDLCLFAELCGTCCIYEIMIAATFKQAIEAVSTAVGSWNLSIRIYLVLVMLPLFALCMIRNLKYLAPFCLIADLFVAICVLTTMYYSISQAGDISERPAFKSFQGLMHFCGIFLYSIDGVGIALPIENNMEKPQYFPIVLQVGMTVVILSLVLTGFFGYWGWGESCQSPITMHMPMDTYLIILQFLLVVILAITFALNFWVPFRVIWHYIGRKIIRRRGLWERLCRGILIILMTCFTLSSPNLIWMMVVIGNVFLSFVAFIFPASVDCLVNWEDSVRMKKRWILITKNIFIIVIGIMLTGSVFYI